MTTRLDKTIKRELDIKGVTYTLSFSPQGIKIVEKGKRKGKDLTWDELVGGDVELANDLRNSISPGSPAE
ncbi:MAG: hypothetical protein ACT4OZ_08220 [Gemmatimonadota bacterium]